MGGAKLAHSLGLPTLWKAVENERWRDVEDGELENRRRGVSYVEIAGSEAKDIIGRWEKGAPFLRALYDMTSQVAAKRGYIKTILGRRCRFQINHKGEYTFTHKALNRLCQGSAADQTKRGMLDLWNAGVTPLLTVHDELIFSVRDESQAREYADVMESALPLEVPSVVDVHCGTTWGDVEK